MQLFSILVAISARLLNPYVVFGETKFSNMTKKEFSKSHGYRKPSNYKSKNIPDIYTKKEISNIINTSIDWRDHNVVLPVKDQGLCGSCWAFSAASNIESQLALATGGLESLSEEELVDCVSADYGCDGGWPDDAFEYIKVNGITTESLYNYTAGIGLAGKCKTLNQYQYITKIARYVDIPNDEGQMLAYLKEHGPISVALDANTFQSYKTGIVTDCVSDRIDHAVLIVGYAPVNGTYPAYWIIRNSWGINWGENGYIRVAFGSNQCLITNKPSSSVII